MTDAPRDLTLERVNRVTRAVADLSESHAVQGGQVLRALETMQAQLAGMKAGISALTKEMRALANEEARIGNRIEEAFNRALRANIRMNGLKDSRGV